MYKKYFKERRTIRSFSNRRVDDSLLEQLLELASHAPTTGNMQLYSVIITREPENIKKLAETHFNQPASTGANVLLTFCADFNRFTKWCEVSDAEPGFENFQSFISALLDTTILAQQFCTLAEMEGLGCCYLGTTTYNAPRISEILSLPRLVVPVVTLAIGWPEGDSEVSDRTSPTSFIHKESYNDYDERSIKDFFAEKESREDSAKFIEENGKKTLAQVFTDVRYPKSNNEYFSKIFIDYIQKQGFLK